MAARFDKTSFGGANSQFQTTEWTKILNSEVGESILGELYLKYSRPVFSYLRRKGFNSDQAKDLVQGFFSEKVLGRQLLQKADRSRGKFRTFLLTAVRNYAIDIHRTVKPMQEIDEKYEKSTDIGDPEAEFDIVWAKELLQSILAELQAECESRNKMIHWKVFKSWLLEPNFDKEKVDMSAICVQYDIDDPSKAYNMISNLKGRFRKILRRRLSRHLDSETEIDDEINHFLEIFSRNTTR